VARRIFRELDLDGEERDSKLPESDTDDHEPVPESEAPRADRRREGGRTDPWALLGALLETGDKAKTEMVRMLGREVRTYLEALELHKDLHHIVTNYSLEVKASIHLNPLGDTPPPPSASAAVMPRSSEPDPGGSDPSSQA
jgi:hypothetical protein